MRIRASGSGDIRATIQALQGLDREVKKQVRTHTRTMTRGQWERELEQRATSKPQRLVLAATGRTQATDQNIVLKSAGSRKAIGRGGLTPSEGASAFEFGANRDKTTTQRSRTGTSYERHASRQLPPRRARGHVVFPSAAELIPRIASLWVQTVMRTVHDVLEKR